jgi:CubicO group peptidase (beta-lactamase class C family)
MPGQSLKEPAMTVPDADAAGRVDDLFSTAPGPTPGAAVGVVRDGEVVLAKAYGSADLEHDIAITPRSRFYMASVSKQFTAMAALIAAEEQGIDLEAPVREIIPELPPCAAEASLYHLLTHTSGLRDYFTLGALAGLSPETPYTEHRVLRMLARQERLNFAPGEAILYSNSGYVLASILVERATGQNLDAFARQRIFAPLGMDATRFQHDHTAIVPDKVFGYERRGETWGAGNSLLDVVGDGGMYSSVQDMLLWLQNLQAPRVGAAQLKRMRAPARMNGGREYKGYGMGFFLAEHRGRATVEHSGGLMGYRTQLLWIPSERLGVVMLSNSTETNPPELTRRIADIYLEPAASEPPSTAPTTAPTPEELEAISGLYRWAAGGYFEIAARDAGLVMVPANAPLVPTGPGAFRIGEATFAFDADGSGRGTPPEGGPPAPFTRCDPKPLSRKALIAYLGRYASTELQTTHTIVRAGEGLALEIGDDPAQLLRPAQTDEMLLGAFGVCLVFERGANGRIAGFHIDDVRAKSMAFKRVR